MPQRVIRGEDFGQALATAGIIDGPINSYRRIVIDAEAGRPVMVYAERYADDRWLNVAFGLTGVQVTTSASGSGNLAATPQVGGGGGGSTGPVSGPGASGRAQGGGGQP